MTIAEIIELIKSIKRLGQDAHIAFRKGQYAGVLYGTFKEEPKKK